MDEWTSYGEPCGQMPLHAGVMNRRPKDCITKTPAPSSLHNTFRHCQFALGRHTDSLPLRCSCELLIYRLVANWHALDSIVLLA